MMHLFATTPAEQVLARGKSSFAKSEAAVSGTSGR